MSKQDGVRKICITDEAYQKLVLMAEAEERRTCRFVSLQKLASRLILAAAAQACTATFSPDAEQACWSIFQAWEEAGQACQLEPTMPDPNKVCWRAYDVGDSLESDCLPWIRAHKCEELDNDHFQVHCGEAIYLRTW